MKKFYLNLAFCRDSLGRCLPLKNPSVDFSGDCRIAAQFCTLLSRPPWLNIPWQGRITFPELVEGEVCAMGCSTSACSASVDTVVFLLATYGICGNLQFFMLTNVFFDIRGALVACYACLPSYFVTRGFICYPSNNIGALRGFAKGLPRRGGSGRPLAGCSEGETSPPFFD